MKNAIYTNPTIPPTTTMITGSIITLSERIVLCNCDS